MKKLILPLLAAAALTTGCSTTNISELVAAASKDPAKVHFAVTSVWGTVTYDRDGSGTNSPAIIAK